MKLTVLTWLRDSLIGVTGRTIELLFRIILCCLPLGVYLLLIQFRSKASTIRNISVYTEDNSMWQHIFPGFILVAINPNLLKESWFKTRKNIQTWMYNNRFILIFGFAFFVAILLMIITMLIIRKF